MRGHAATSPRPEAGRVYAGKEHRQRTPGGAADRPRQPRPISTGNSRQAAPAELAPDLSTGAGQERPRRISFTLRPAPPKRRQAPPGRAQRPQETPRSLSPSDRPRRPADDLSPRRSYPRSRRPSNRFQPEPERRRHPRPRRTRRTRPGRKECIV